MTNIKLSEKGRAFLRSGSAAYQVASAIAGKKDNFQQEELIVKVDKNRSITVKSASVTIAEPTAA